MSLSDGLILHMPMTSSYLESATVCTDLARGNHGTATGTPPTFDSDGIDLNGDPDHVNCGDVDLLDFVDGSGDLPFSVSIWLNAVDITSNYLVSKNSNSDGWMFSTSSTNRISLICQSSLGNRIARWYDTPLTAYEGSWIHLVGTYDGSGSDSGIKLYLDGDELATVEINQGIYTGMVSNTEDLTIGKWDKDPPIFMDGKVAFIRIYDRVLSGDEVFTLNALGRKVPTQGFRGRTRGLIRGR